MHKVGTLYRYHIGPGGKPNEKIEPELLRGPMLYPVKYIDDLNSHTNLHGKFIKVDEEETKARYAKGKERIEAMEHDKDIEDAIALTKITKVAESGLKKKAKKVTRKKPVKKPKNGN